MKSFEDLYSKYEKNEISLQDFQRRLEAMLGSYDNLTKQDEEFIKTTTNQIELIIFTIPEQSQGNKVRELLPEISRYFQNKSV